MRIMKTVLSAVSILSLSVAISAGLSGICSSDAYAEVPVLVDEDFSGFSAWDDADNKAGFNATSWNQFGTATTINGVDYSAGAAKPWTWSDGTRDAVRLKDQARYFDATDKYADNDLSNGSGSAGNVVEVFSNTQVVLTFTPSQSGDYVISFNYNPSVELVYRFNDDGSQNTQPPYLFTTDVYSVKMETGGVTTTLLNIKPQDLFQSSADYSVFYDTSMKHRWYITTGTGSRFAQFTKTVTLAANIPVELTFDAIDMPMSKELRTIRGGPQQSFNAFWFPKIVFNNFMVGPTAGATAFADEDYELANKLYAPLVTAVYAVSTSTLPFSVSPDKYKIQPSDEGGILAGTLVLMNTTDKYNQMNALHDRLTALLATLPEHKANKKYRKIRRDNNKIGRWIGSQENYAANVGIIDTFMNENFGRIVWILHHHFLTSLYSWDALDFVGSSSGKP